MLAAKCRRFWLWCCQSWCLEADTYIQRSDGSAKGDWDVGITIDVLDVAARVDEVVLASGDGDFDLLLERVRAGGAEATAYGVPGLTAQSLIRAATRYVPIEGRLLLR